MQGNECTPDIEGGGVKWDVLGDGIVVEGDKVGERVAEDGGELVEDISCCLLGRPLEAFAFPLPLSDICN